MSKILHCFLCLIFLGYTGVAMAATVVGGGTVVTPGGGTVVGPSATPSGSYSCPTYRKYSSCAEGYYLAYSYTGTSYNSIRYYSTPRAGNACRPCTDYDTYNNRPEGYYYCAGGTARPVFNKVTITYDLNGGDGSVPSPELCTPNSTCPLVKGNTTSFWRAGYVFKGWTPEGSTSDKVVDFDDFVPGSENMTLYAVWTPCGIGMYKPGSGTQAAAACSSCPELTPGFEYFPATTNASLTECRQGITNAEDANEYCDAPSVTTELFDIQCYAMSDGTWGDCAIGNAWTAKPGSYVGIWKQTMPAEDVIENMCIPCGVGTYSEGGLINSCSSCPELTPGFEYAPLKRLTSMNNCTQVNYDISLINNNCTSLSGQESRPKINIRASAETGDWATYAVSPTEGAVYAVPGAYVNQDMMTNGEHLDIAGFDASKLCVMCTDATFSPGGDVHSCSACPPGYDANTETGKTSAAECQISCDAGTYVATENAACTTVGSGYYKAAHMVNYGSTSTRDQCPANYRDGAAASSESGCQTSCDAGTYVATENATCTTVGSGYYKAAHMVNYGSTSTRDQCPANYRDGAAASSESGCQASCDAGTYVKTANAACTAVGSGYYKAAHMVNYGSTSTRDQCPSGYQNSAAGAAVINDCYMNVSGGKYVARENATTTATCVAGTYKAAHTVYYGSTSSCSACTGRTKYSGAGASECSPVDSGYYSTGCNASGNNCTGQSQCTGATYCSGGVQNSCPAQTSGWTRNGGTGWTSYTQCNQRRTASAISQYCVAGTLRQVAISATEWGETFISEDLEARGGAYVSGQTCLLCTEDNYCTGGTAAPKDCPTGYPNSDAGAAAVTSCYSNTKSRPWSGSQVNGDIPTNCSAVTEWGICSRASCEYVAYSNSTGTADGTIKSGCETNADSCIKPVQAVSAKPGFYDAGTTCTACPSAYPNSADGNEGGISKCYMSVSGGKYVATANATSVSTCVAGTYKAAHTVYYGSTSSCSACTGRTKYSGAGASACSPVDSGYYSTGCNTSGNNCTGQSQCTGATYCSSGVQNSCPAQTSGWTRNGGTGWTSYTQCNQTRAATSVSSYCSAGQLKQTATSATAWGASTISTAFQAKAGAYVNGQTCSQCTADNYCTGGTAAPKDCPTGYPNSDAGAAAVTSCYSNTKSRPWSGSQVNGTVPTNCSAVTEWGTCSKSACEYVAYANSAGTADGTIKSGCETNAANCTKPVKAVSAKSGFYDAGTTCTECPSGYPNSDADNEGGVTQCYSNTKSRPWSGSQVNGAMPSGCSSVPEWNSCSNPACEYVAYANSAGTADGTIKSGCSTNAANCTRTPKTVSASGDHYVSGVTCPSCPSGYPNSDGGTAGIFQCYSDEKSRPWMGGQISCKTPAGCSDSTCNICTLPACSYVAYSNSTGSADGTIKSGCATNNEDCQQTVKSVTANAGYIVQDNDGVLTCAVCTGATYSAGGSATTCTACPSIYTDNTDSAKTNASQCQVITTGGYYIANANDDTETDCGTTYYCPSETVNYGDTNERNACPVAADHRITDYPDNFYNVVSVSAMNQSWGATNISSIGQCVAQYTVTNERGTFAAENVTYNPETEKYDVFGNHYYSTVNPGYYGNEKWSEGYCDESSRRMLYKDALPCPAGSYCPGFSNVSCGSGEYNDTLGLNSCPVAYPSSPALSSEINACYLTTTPKNFVATANAAQTTCTAGGYCVGGVKVNYGSTGGRTPASKGYYVASTGATTQTPCAVGTYTATTGQTKCTDAVAGTYTTGCGSNNTACTGTAVCANNSYSAAKASSCTACNTADGYGNSGTSAANHAGIASCKASCGGGEYVPTAGGGCVNVGVGYWGAGGTVAQDATLARNQCDSGLTTIGSGAGADEAGDCGRVLNVNGEKIYLRSTKKTTPSLNVGINGKTFYGNMGTATKGTLRINSGGTTYSVYDDSM